MPENEQLRWLTTMMYEQEGQQPSSSTNNFYHDLLYGSQNKAPALCKKKLSQNLENK